MNFEQFIESLFNAPENKDFNNDFKEKIKTITDVQLNKFWSSLLNFLKERETVSSVTSFLQSEFKEDSFFDYIQDSSDKDLELSNLTNYWNESIQDIIDYFYKYFNNKEEITKNELSSSIVTNGKIPTGYKNFSISDLSNADAANAFGPLLKTVWTEIVRPWYNIDWESYYSVRKITDLDQKAIQDDSHLHFTRIQYQNEYEEKMNHWIRLIMPKNSRRVQIEDLNRNFWVISQTVAAVSAYLFSDNAPIPYLLKNILKELLQLWDNILYLWTAFSIISQKATSDLRTIILPLPNNNLQHYQKYDNFIEKSIIDKEQIIKRIKFLIKQYSNSNLCIIPYIRNNNYYKNYYSSQSFPCIILYNATTKKISYVPTLVKTNEESNKMICFNPEDFKDQLYAIRETETYHKWSFPISNINKTLDEDFHANRFYGILRIIPEIELAINTQGQLYINKFKLIGIDAAAQSLFGDNSEIISYTLNETINENSEVANFIEEILVTEPDLGNLDIYESTIKQAYYLGEIPSYSNFSASRPYFQYNDGKRIIGEGKLIKIGNYLPKSFYDYNGTSFYKDLNYYAEQKVPNGSRPTDYLLNLAITGVGNVNNVTNIFSGSLGAANVISSDNCYLFTPVVNGKNSYSLNCERIESKDMNAERYKELGLSVIADYIKNDTNFDLITYFIAAVGTRPWHNTAASNVFQSYWSIGMLTHMYRYIPVTLEDYVSFKDLAEGTEVYKNGIKIGTLQVLGIVNKQEKAFSVIGSGNTTDSFITTTTTWRLPQLIPEKNIAGYLIFTERVSGETYFVDPTKDDVLNQVYITKGIDGVTQELNDNYQKYLDNTDILMSKDNIQLQLSSPAGVWSVFDGNSNVGYQQNINTYSKQNDRREVAYTNFTFLTDTQELEFKPNISNTKSYPAEGRIVTTNTFSECNPEYMLSETGTKNMEFTW